MKAYETMKIVVTRLDLSDVLTSSPNENDNIGAPDSGWFAGIGGNG